LLKARAAETFAKSTADERVATSRAQDLAARLSAAEGLLQSKEAESRSQANELTVLKTERATFDARVSELTRLHDRMKDSFASLAADALKASSDSFFQVAKNELEGLRSVARRDLDDKEKAFATLIAPIRENLDRYGAKLEQLARDRDESLAA
jgi:hypothetical protein